MDIGWLPLAAFILTALGWLSRELWRWRKAKRLATEDATKTLNQKKVLLEELVSKIADPNNKNSLIAQLDEVNAALLGLYGERLRRTLKDAGLPAEETLIAGGQSQLKPQQATHLREVITEVNALSPSPSVQDLLTQGNVYYYIKQYQDAKNIYDSVIKSNPNNPSALSNRGIIHFELERYSDAIADFTRSLELSPDNPDTLFCRGSAYVKLQGYEEAFTDYNRTLELKPDDFDTFYNLACLFSLWGKTDDALTYLEKAIKLDKKYREDAKTDKDFDNIREDPRFKKLIEPD